MCCYGNPEWLVKGSEGGNAPFLDLLPPNPSLFFMIDFFMIDSDKFTLSY
jgi:hypothetical protein